MTLVLPDGTSLYYEVEGQGPPLLLLHGGLGLDQSTLRPGLDGLADTAQLVFLDIRGCGRSSPLPPGASVSHDDWVADADALRARLGFDRWSVFGHSYGSFLALEYALRYPHRLDRLILCSVAPAFAHGEAVMSNAHARGTPEAITALENMLAAPVATDEAFEAAWRAIAPLYLHRPTPAALSAITDGVRYRSDAFNASVQGCLPNFDVRDRLGEIQSPTLVVNGRHDWITPPEHGAIPLVERLPKAELVILEQSGHFPFVEEAEAFERVVRQWIHAPGQHPA